MKLKTALWIATAVFAVASFIDIMDGHLPKLVSSVCITLALACYAFGLGRTDQRRYKSASYFLILIALGAFAYRLFTYYSAS